MPETIDRNPLIAALQARADAKRCTYPPEDCPNVPLPLTEYCDGCLLRAALKALRADA